MKMPLSNTAVTNGNDSKNINIHYCDVGMSLFKEPLFWDTEITVNGTQHYKTHRAILSVHSGYFAALFDKEMVKYPAEIELIADDLLVFQIMIKFLYVDTIPSNLKYEQLQE